MSAAAAHVVLLIAVTGDPSSEVVSRAALDALAAPFTEPPQVELRQVSESASRSRLAALERESQADAIAVLICARPGCAHATLRVVAGGAAAASRAVRFGPRDQLAERGRAIGLLASTLLPAEWSRAAPSPPPAAAAREGEPRAAGPAVSPGAVAAATVTTGATGLAAAPTPTRWAFETVADLFAGTSGVSDLGLTLGAQRVLWGRWAARAALKLELGETPGAPVTSRGVGGALGVAWTSASLARPGHFGVGARADFIAVERQVRLSTTTEVEQSSRLTLGGDVMGQVGFALSPGAALVAGLGAELLSKGPSAGDSDDARAAGPSALRLVAELGILARF